MKTYPVNEMFLSLQGEGARAGSLNVFVRFAGCNLTCTKDGDAGFDCDTEFASSRKLTAEAIAAEVANLWHPQSCKGPTDVIFTGGEPLLHVDGELLNTLHDVGVRVMAFETNGTQPIPESIDPYRIYVACSPKTAEHTIRVQRIDELRYVRHAGHGIPQPSQSSLHRFLSPAWDVDPAKTRANLLHCIELVKQHPSWRLSVQMHKLWQVR